MSNLIKINEVLRRCVISRATLYRLLANNEFPRQVLLSKRAIAFYENEVDEWIKARKRVGKE
ncbi:AlpA family phage regulatory protein [Scandinavium sp. H11S7]|uniref:AlpA family phage regulatory protein n=2 Tax=Scandinavium hiltneri TaxID=2926519 RepID=A0ABT2E176_9ENTR|nr:AlpA family phage regulatory protein [Scandinavium hiltneri]